MKLDFFWNSWGKPAKTLYQVLLFALVTSMIVFAFAYALGNNFLIEWEITNIISPVQTLFDSYYLGLYHFPIYVDNYVIQQGFEASELQILNWPAILLMAWLAFFFSFMLALITDLPRFWFVVAVVLFTAALLVLRLDYLILFGRYDKSALIIAFLLFYPSLYYFHFVNTDVPVFKRLIAYLLATVIFGLIIFQFSTIESPVLHVANYGIYVPLIITVVFTFMVGHDVIGALLQIVAHGSGKGDSSSSYHFLIIGFAYLVNVTLLVLKNARIIDMNIYLLGPFLLLVIATVAGIWGFREREINYQGIFAFRPTGAFIFALMAITTFITLSYFFCSGNDFFIEVVEDAVVFSQLGYGSMFIVYFLANFYDLMRKGANVAKILYKPVRMPYFSYRLAGLIIILALFLRFNKTPYYQSIAGFYSGIGDLYLQIEDYASAREYYELSSSFSTTGHRTNYAMATLEKKNGNKADEIRYLRRAVRKNPTPHAFANLAAGSHDKENYFEALFTLKDGLERFPKSGPLMNNLGMIYQEIDYRDSAYYQFQNASQVRISRLAGQANTFAFLRMQGLSIKTDTLEQLLSSTSGLAAINNLVVLANELQKTANDAGQVRFRDPENERIDQIVYNYNKILNDASCADSVFFNEMSGFYASGRTSWFEEQLQQASALAWYKKGEYANAFEQLNLLAIQNPDDKYYSLLGKLAMKMDAPDLAVNYFKNSFQNGNIEVASELAFAYMKAGELDKAAFIWRQIRNQEDVVQKDIAQRMIPLVEAKDIDDVIGLDPDTRLGFLLFRSHEFDAESLERLTLLFGSNDARALAFLSLFDVYKELNMKQKAAEMLQKAGGIAVALPQVLERINLAQCQFAHYFDEPAVSKQLLANLERGNPIIDSYLQLFQCQLLPDSVEAAQKLNALAGRNPFFTPGVLRAVSLLNSMEERSENAYSTLLAAIRINPFSDELNQAYALQCIRMGLKSYALATREELRQSMNSVGFAAFDEEFQALLSWYEEKQSNW
jgi:hypothetical protein